MLGLRYRQRAAPARAPLILSEVSLILTEPCMTGGRLRDSCMAKNQFAG
jgi:hypothetical protein